MQLNMKALVSVLVMLVGSGCRGCGDRDKDKISLYHWERVDVRMTKAQVEAILGAPYECGDRTAANDIPEVVCIWKSADTNKGIAVYFQAGKVVRKGKTGLDAPPRNAE